MSNRASITNRTSIITDWRVRNEEALPDIPPGGEYECAIAPQKFVVLYRILVQELTLVRLEIGAIDDVPFELESADGPRRSYRLRSLDDDALKKRLVAIGAAVATPDSIALSPGLEVWAHLRNDTAAPAKPRVALLVQEEVT